MLKETALLWGPEHSECGTRVKLVSPGVRFLPCPALSCPALNMTKDSEAREMEQGQCVPEPDIRDSLRENRGCWKSAILKGWCDSV